MHRLGIVPTRIYVTSAEGHTGKSTIALGVLETLARMEEHLSTNGVKLENTEYALGKKLAFDPKTERFADEKANALLTREYRKGFEVPAKA